MARIDRLHHDLPFAGSRLLRGLLKKEDFEVDQLHVSRLMKRIGTAALYRRPNTSKSVSGHKVYCYLLRGIVIDRPNQVWATDINYIPMAPHGPSVHLFDCCNRLVHATGPVVACADLAGSGILHRSC